MMPLYPQQREALSRLRDFLESDDTVFILGGYAGTGKTTMIRALCDLLPQYGQEPLLMAPTGRAARILSEKSGLKASTIHSAIYHHEGDQLVLHDEEGNVSVARMVSLTSAPETDYVLTYFSVETLGDEHDPSRSVIIVDEASLIPAQKSWQEGVQFGTGSLLEDLLTYSEWHLGCKLVFVGDPNQLPPVTDPRSCALSTDYFASADIPVRSYTLTEVIRQEHESLILKNAMLVKDLIQSEVRNTLRLETRKGEVEPLTMEQVAQKYQEICPTPMMNRSAVICYSNKQALWYNRAVRERYFPDQPSLRKGDILQVVRNNYFGDHLVLNGDFIRIVDDPGPEETVSVPVWVTKGTGRERPHVRLSFRRVEYETETGMRGQRLLLTTLLDSERASLTAEESKALYIHFYIRHSSERQSPDLSKKMIEDPYVNALQAKYGYAITCHKAQGGEWEQVIVDFSQRGRSDESSLRWIYTALTRAKRSLYGVHMPDVSPFEKLDLFPISRISKVSAEVYRLQDLPCDYLGAEASPSQRAKCLSAAKALAEIGYKLTDVATMPYRDRYTIEGPSGRLTCDCLYKGSGLYSSYSVQPKVPDESAIVEALRDEREYEFDVSYQPALPFLDQLYQYMRVAASECGVTITGVCDHPDQHYVLYGLRTSASFASLQFYYLNKGFLTKAMPSSLMGGSDELLDKFIKRIRTDICTE